MSRIRELSADEEARRLAFVRERALHDEVSFLNEARREGHQEGHQEGLQEGEQLGIEKGRQEERQEAEQRALAEKRETVRNLLSFGVLNDEQVAEVTGMAVDEIAQLRIEDKH